MSNTDTPGTGDPLDAIIATVNQLIEAGGATPEDLADLKMDLEDCKAGDSEPDEMSPQDAGGMAGMIEKVQGGGYK